MYRPIIRMYMEREHIVQILYQQLNGETLSASDADQLEQWRAQSPANQQLFNEIDKGQGLDRYLARILNEDKTDKALQLFEQRHAFQPASRSDAPISSLNASHHIPVYRRPWFRYAAAAILLIGTATAIFRSFNQQPNKAVTKNTTPIDIPPGGNKAVLQLADGSSILLDSAASGQLAQLGNTKLVKQSDGRIAYESIKGTTTDPLAYNTLRNPIGSKVVDMLLSDGSHIWLNAGSSIRYPVNFVGGERTVTVEGEAYFEIAPNAGKPFRVLMADSAMVEVLGTEFNISSYADEPMFKTALAQGSVRIKKGGGSVILTPGQQAVTSPATGGPVRVQPADIDEVLAWKNGQFNFNGQDIETIMRAIGRWYGVSVRYEGSVSKETYSGIVSRNSNISQVLKIIGAGGVKFTLTEKTILVSQ